MYQKRFSYQTVQQNYENQNKNIISSKNARHAKSTFLQMREFNFERER
jgi:hypothetical protein